MSFYVVISWNPADEVPFGWRVHVSKPLATKREAWDYVKQVQKRAKLSDVQLHDLAVLGYKPRPGEECGYDVDDEHQVVNDHARWRINGRKTWRSLFG